MSWLDVWGVVLAAFWAALALDVRRWWPAGLRLRLGAPDDERDGDRPRERPKPNDGTASRDVDVLVPAHNEADMVPECLPSLLAQSADLRQVLFVDDRSSDATGDRAREAIEAAAAARVARVVEGVPPAPGWSGKLHALSLALRESAGDPRGRPRWFLFTDADIRHPPGSIRALTLLAEREGLDMVSVMVRLRSESVWERLLIPPFVYFFQLLYPFRCVRRPASRCAAAAGGCVLISSELLLDRVGGLEAIRDAVIDDVSLAKQAKAAGGRIWLGICPEMLSVRPYDRLSEIAAMVSRTAFTQLRHSYSLLAACLLGLVALFVAPPFVLLGSLAAGDTVGAIGAGAAWAIGAATLAPVVRHQRVPPIYALTLPAASLLYGWMTWLSGWRHARGAGVRWRGRELPDPRASR